MGVQMGMEIKSRSVTRSEDVPRQEHWAIIEGSSVSHEADERSRQCPGHGYPAYTENVITYRAYFNEAEFLGELERKFNSAYLSKEVIGLHVDKLYTKQTVVRVVEKKLTTGS